ncbi:MAG: glycerophosphodiester phosphodiesterase [Planctomycetota bacterium]
MNEASLARPLLVAHRGNSAFAPENTLASFRSALQLGVDAVELDMRFSADGDVVLLHDEDVDRTTDGGGLVSELSTSQIARLDAGAWKSPDFAGERVPLLRDALRLLAGRCRIFAEMKVRGLARPLAEAAAAAGALPHLTVLYWGKHAEDAEEARRHLPGVPLLELGDAPPTADAAFFETRRAPGLAGLNCKFETLTPEFMEAALAAGVPVFTWTLNDAREMRTAIDMGCAGIATDNPALLLEVLSDS